MKKILAFILFFSLTLTVFSNPGKTDAHIAGQPPFFLMNEKYADFYPVYSTSLSDFVLPQDIAPETYLINEDINFKIEKAMLPFPQKVIEQITFSWDYGDGTKASGTENNHAYTKPGSYLLTINADYGDYSDPNTKPVIQAVLIHILPNEGYQLPQPSIKINGEIVNDPLIDTLTFAPGKNLAFEPVIKNGTAKVESYFWDQGNGKSTTQKTFSIKYTSNDPAYLFPFLRIIDSNGFIVDTYAQIENQTGEATTNNSTWLQSNGLLILLGVNAIILIGGGYFLFKRK